MSFLKISSDFFSRPKVKKYIELSADRLAILPVASLLLALKEKAQTGRISITSAEFEAIGHWRGRRGLGVTYMLEAELLAEVENGYKIVDWEAEQGHILKFHERAKKAAKALWSRPSVDATSNA